MEIRVFFNIRFSSRKSQSQQKLAKKITHFTIQFRSKNLTHFTNLNSFEIENNMLPKHSQKTFSVYKFSSKHVSVWCQKKHLHCTFLDAQELHFSSSLKANVCIFLYISVKDILFQRRSKILCRGGWFGLRQNDFHKVARCLGLANALQFYILIKTFGNSTIFQHLNKTLKFPRQFGLRLRVRFLLHFS